MGFRPEIQALRAVAVALVVVFHLWPDALPGGYIGVDVFFVISGFLITSHLASEQERTGRISLPAFWGRRLRRLLPAASLVLLSSLLAMFAVVPRSLWQQTVIEIGASALYVQNWVLAGNSVDYLAADGTPTLVQHFWSLSVEEQFYLLWPLLLILSLLVPRGRIALVAAVFAGSLAYSAAQAGTSSGYFDTGTRAWEFAAGALLALAPGAVAWLRSRAALAGTLSWAGVAAIAVAALLFTGQTPFPGVKAILPVAGTVLVIAAGSGGPRWAAGRASGWAPLQFVGGISYPLYLWHWPLVVGLPYLLETDPGGWVAAVLPVAVLLAWATTRFIEAPLRRSVAPAWSYRLVAVSVAMILVVTGVTWTGVRSEVAAAERDATAQFGTDPCYGAAAMADRDGCRNPFAVTDRVDTAFAAQDRGALALACNSNGTTVKECEFGDLEDPVRTVAVIGNSHAAALVAGFEAFGLAHHWKILLMRKTDCLGVSTLDLGGPSSAACTAWTANVLAELKGRQDIDAVVFATHADALHYLAAPKPSSEAVAELRREIGANLAAISQPILVVGDTPGTRPDPAPECVYLHRREYDPCAMPQDDGLSDGNVESIAARDTPGVAYLSLLPAVCDASGCHAVIGGAIVYFDDHHLSASFSRSLAPYLGSAIQSLWESAG